MANQLNATLMASELRTQVFNQEMSIAKEKIFEEFKRCKEYFQASQSFTARLRRIVSSDCVTALQNAGYVVETGDNIGTNITLPESQLIDIEGIDGSSIGFNAQEMANYLRSNSLEHFLGEAHNKIQVKYESYLKDVQAPYGFSVHFTHRISDVIYALKSEDFIVEMSPKGGFDVRLPDGNLKTNSEEAPAEE